MKAVEMKFEIDIKALLINHLIEKKVIKEGSLIINEFTYGGFSRRVDLALVNNNEILGIEVKSEFDTLNRLDGQVSDYLKVFDKVIVVVATKHLEKAKKQLPDRVGIWEITDSGIKVINRGKKLKIKEKSIFIDLMRVVDLAKTSRLFELECDVRSRNELVKAVSKLSVTKLREAALRGLFNRYSDGVNLFLNSVKGRDVKNTDLLALSQNKKVKADKELPDIIADLNNKLLNFCVG